MKKVVRLTERDLTRIVRRVIMEQEEPTNNEEIKNLMKKMDVILHHKAGYTDYKPQFCTIFMYNDGEEDGFHTQFKKYQEWLEKNGFDKGLNASRLCFGIDAVPKSNVEKIKKIMTKKGWLK